MINLIPIFQSVNPFRWRARALSAEACLAGRMAAIETQRHIIRKKEEQVGNWMNQCKETEKQRDDACRALDMERAAHRVTADRLATATLRLEETTRQKGECWAELIETQARLDRVVAETKEEAPAP